MLYVNLWFISYLIKARIVAPISPPFGINKIFPLMRYPSICLIHNYSLISTVLLNKNLSDQTHLSLRFELLTKGRSTPLNNPWLFYRFLSHTPLRIAFRAIVALGNSIFHALTPILTTLRLRKQQSLCLFSVEPLCETLIEASLAIHIIGQTHMRLLVDRLIWTAIFLVFDRA